MIASIHIEGEVEALIEILLHALQLIPDLRLLEKQLIYSLISLCDLIDSILIAILADDPIDRDFHGKRESTLADQILQI